MHRPISVALFVTGLIGACVLGLSMPLGQHLLHRLTHTDRDAPNSAISAAVEPFTEVIITVDRNAGRRPINPDIYGINFAREPLASELNLPVRRWGGNATTRYNWQNDTANRASDWFFENIPKKNPNPELLPAGSAVDQFVEQNRRTGTKTLLTVPLIGWTPKSRAVGCGFSIELYGRQQEVDPHRPDCGNGKLSDGTFITNNAPEDISRSIGPEFVKDWVRHLTNQFGTAQDGGVTYYALDNEPMLWHLTHRDVHPDPVGYDELRDRTISYAEAIKEIDSAAQTFGPVIWGWPAYFQSAADQQVRGSRWRNGPDQRRHGGLPLVPWYLQEMRIYEENHGIRILDYLDLHYYPQAVGVRLAPVGDAQTEALRLRSTRSLWDFEYADESWVGEPIALIPRMRQWVDEYYPNTKLAITEYNWGATEHISGALAQADILGIFGREGLDLATIWAIGNKADEPVAYAFRMYRNYDGRGSAFGDTSIYSASSDQDTLAVYAAEHSTSGVVTVIIINKSLSDVKSKIKLAGIDARMARMFRYDGSNLESIAQMPAQTITSAEFSAIFPSYSITLFVIEPL